jgi:L-malate glycosyltransferase
LVALRHRVSIAVAVSEYNARELAAMGYQDVRIVPPVLDPFRLLDVEPNPSTLNHLDNALGAPFLLYVGQLLPHKRPDLLVEAMHIAATYLNFEPYLLLVGHARLSRYHQAIAEQIRELNLPNVHLVGSVSTEDLAAYYRRAMAVVTASEHEGFCVPLVEAMAFGNPVIARACGAIPETLADGGLCLPADAGPELFAEAFFAVTHDDEIRNDLARRARERAEVFRVDRAKEDLFSVLLEVV